MKKLVCGSLCAFIIVLLCSSCQKNKDSIVFEKINVKKVLRVVGSNIPDSANTYCNVDWQLLYPSFAEKDTVAKKIQSEILLYAMGDSICMNMPAKTAVDSMIASILADYKSDVEFSMSISKRLKATAEGDNIPFLYHNSEFKLNTSVLYNQNGILSYELVRYMYTGGAHGMEFTKYLVFNIKTGDKITLHDVFEDGYEPMLSDLMKKQIMFDRGFECEEQMLNGGYFSAENIAPVNNFYLSNEGITFVFNPYEIAAYAIGETVVTIPFSKLKNVLRKGEDSVLGSFLEKVKK